jgi:hypothetical protein
MVWSTLSLGLQLFRQGRRFVWASIANVVLQRAQIAHVRNKYGLFGDKAITLSPPPMSGAFRVDGCERRPSMVGGLL